MSYVITAVFASLLIFDGRRERKGREKTLYIVLSALSVLLSVLASVFAKQDHVGASLSGMISIFMR